MDQFHISKEPTLKAGERIDDLQFQNYRIIQRDRAFCFGTDSVLLSHFANAKSNQRVVDLGSGTGAISVLMAAHNDTLRFDMVEIQEDIADMAQRTVDMNALGERISVHNMDMRLSPKALGCGVFDLVVCNPPYSRAGTAIESTDDNKRMSRHESEITLAEICKTAASLLKTGGRFAAVFPAQRLFELMTEMQNTRLAPKRVRLVHATVNHAPRLALIDSVKHGGSQLHWMPPLIHKNTDGSPTNEWASIYGI